MRPSYRWAGDAVWAPELLSAEGLVAGSERSWSRFGGALFLRWCHDARCARATSRLGPLWRVLAPRAAVRRSVPLRSPRTPTMARSRSPRGRSARSRSPRSARMRGVTRLEGVFSSRGRGPPSHAPRSHEGRPFARVWVPPAKLARPRRSRHGPRRRDDDQTVSPRAVLLSASVPRGRARDLRAVVPRRPFEPRRGPSPARSRASGGVVAQSREASRGVIVRRGTVA